MATYFRFLFLMSMGMLGLGLVMTTLMDSLLVDWDLGDNFRRYAEGFSRKARFIQVHNYNVETAQVVTRTLPLRTPLPKEIRLVEAAQGRPVVQTPLFLPRLPRPTTPAGGRRVPPLMPPVTPPFIRISP